MGRVQNIKDIKLIVIHCTASPENKDYSFEQLLKDHIARGFGGCGYHLFVRKDGTVHKGREFTSVGAHVAGYNTNSIGISYEGGVTAKLKPKDTRTEAQKEKILDCIFQVLKAIREAGGDTRKVKIVGHRDLSPDKNGDGIITADEWLKACPCFNASEEYKDITKLF